jgi:GNAT superfamily N-acetyltransferase
MIRQVAKTELDRRAGATLIETDRIYFELAAQVVDLSVGQLVWMPGLNELAASCVIHRISPQGMECLTNAWVDEIEEALRQRHIHFDVFPDDFASVLRGRGYGERGEIGFIAPDGHPSQPDNFQLCEVRTNADWNLKLCLHEEAMEGPDGYTNQADLWVEMERRKCTSGSMRSYLVRRDGEIVATVGTIVEANVLRLKNIVVAANLRRQGIGQATVQLLWQLAETDHACRLAVFGVQDGKGSRMYKRAGLYQVNEQYEWSRILTAHHD